MNKIVHKHHYANNIDFNDKTVIINSTNSITAKKHCKYIAANNIKANNTLGSNKTANNTIWPTTKKGINITANNITDTQISESNISANNTIARAGRIAL